MADYVVNIAIDAVIDALKAFILPFYLAQPDSDTANIVRGQGNRVAMPPSPCIVLTEVLQQPLETPIQVWPNADPSSVLSITGPKRIDIQIDIYGPTAGDISTALENIFRTSYACDQFPDNIKPLYSSDSLQAPLITGEEQYETHWLLTATLQYNPTLTVPQQSATALAIDIFEDIP